MPPSSDGITAGSLSFAAGVLGLTGSSLGGSFLGSTLPGCGKGLPLGLLLAGEGLVGILLAVFAVIPVGSGSLGEAINLGGLLGNAGGVVFFILIIASMFLAVRTKKTGK